MSGVLIVLAWYAVHILWFRRRLGHAKPAPRHVVREVALIARRFGLTRMPQTWMVNECISPLLWCGRRTRLILPWGLWSELDRRGRQAILSHEIAHLCRRDHWVRRVELVISTLCWWHPLVWWVRHRIEQEADLCCDAWVTWLMPHGRRAYAEALLRTRQRTYDEDRAVPAMGMGVTTARGRSFARRLTMVMTERVRPRQSVAGIGLAGMLALAGWWATPALSCPPKKKPCQPPPTVSIPAPADAPTAVRVPQAPSRPYAVPAPSPPTMPVAPALTE
ncbi:MAG: M56 family metallopeptidase, partial [Planctomycetota bacterium]